MAEIIVPPDVTSDPLVITDLTLKTLDGTGVLDQMLATMRVHLAEQFDKERIQGTDIYNVEMQSDLASSQTYLMTVRQGLFDITRTVDISSMNDKLGALTNFGLRVLYQDSLSKNETKKNRTR